MKKRMLCGILLLALLLTGCARRTTAPEIEIEFPPLIIPRYPPAFHYVPAPETDWQRAYLELLADTRERNDNLGRLRDLYYTQWYYLHDINEDGIPELILKRGDCQAGYYGEVLSCPGDVPYPMGFIPLDHISLYSWPGESALLSLRYASNCEKVSFHNGAVSIDPVWGYDRKTGVKGLLPDAEYLDLYSIACDLPIMDYGKERTAAPVIDDTAVCERLLDTIRNNGMVYGATVNGFGGDTGYCDFQQYQVRLSTSVYGDSVTPTRYLFADLNQDGQRECVLDVGSCAVVLSLQDGIVYAYSGYWFPGGENWTVYDDGIIYSYDTDMEWAYVDRLSFSKDNCYEYGTDLSPGSKIIPWEELK